MTQDELREDRRKDYHWFKSHGVCVECKHRKAVSGRVLCQECTDRRAARKEAVNADPEKRERDKERRREYQKRHRERMRAAGLCLDCGNPVTDGKYYCPECRKRRSEVTLAKYYSRRQERRDATT